MRDMASMSFSKYVERTQSVSKNTKEDMLRRMDFAIDMLERYIEQENNK